MGNRAAHEVAGTREAIAAGAGILYLPPCSPALNPIERLSAKLKALPRQAAARTRGTLWTTIGQPLDAFSPAKRRNHLINPGCELEQPENALSARSRSGMIAATTARNRAHGEVLGAAAGARATAPCPVKAPVSVAPHWGRGSFPSLRRRPGTAGWHPGERRGTAPSTSKLLGRIANRASRPPIISGAPRGLDRRQLPRRGSARHPGGAAARNAAPVRFGRARAGLDRGALAPAAVRRSAGPRRGRLAQPTFRS